MTIKLAVGNRYVRRDGKIAIVFKYDGKKEYGYYCRNVDGPKDEWLAQENGYFQSWSEKFGQIERENDLIEEIKSTVISHQYAKDSIIGKAVKITIDEVTHLMPYESWQKIAAEILSLRIIEDEIATEVKAHVE